MDTASLQNVPQSISTVLKYINGKPACEYGCNHTENLKINIFKMFSNRYHTVFLYHNGQMCSSRKLTHISILDPVSSLMNIIGLHPTTERKERRNPHLIFEQIW
jgi:hypothetical protein